MARLFLQCAPNVAVAEQGLRRSESCCGWEELWPTALGCGCEVSGGE